MLSPSALETEDQTEQNVGTRGLCFHGPHGLESRSLQDIVLTRQRFYSERRGASAGTYVGSLCVHAERREGRSREKTRANLAGSSHPAGMAGFLAIDDQFPSEDIPRSRADILQIEAGLGCY